MAAMRSQQRESMNPRTQVLSKSDQTYSHPVPLATASHLAMPGLKGWKTRFCFMTELPRTWGLLLSTRAGMCGENTAGMLLWTPVSSSTTKPPTPSVLPTLPSYMISGVKAQGQSCGEHLRSYLHFTSQGGESRMLIDVVQLIKLLKASPWSLE